MKVCPACKKDSASDIECTHCSIIFAKWEALHPPATTGEISPADASADTPVEISAMAEPAADPEAESAMFKIKLLLIGLIGIGAAWFFYPSNDEARVVQIFKGYHEAIAAGDTKKIESFFTGPEQKFAGFTLDGLKNAKPEQVKVEKVVVNKGTATLQASEKLDGQPLTEIVEFTKERAQWKISHVAWKVVVGNDAALAKPAGSAKELFLSRPETPEHNDASPEDAAIRFAGKPIPELQRSLVTEEFQQSVILDELIKRGARKEAVTTLNEMLRDRSGGPRHKSYSSWNSSVQPLLKKIGEPLTFDRDVNAHPDQGNEKLSCQEWEIDLRGDSIYSSGGFFVGQDLIDGLSRPIKVQNQLQTSGPRYSFTVAGGGLREPIEKTITGASHSGDQTWNGVLLASGLGQGIYKVSMRVEVLTVTQDGVPKQHSCQMTTLEAEKR